MRSIFILILVFVAALCGGCGKNSANTSSPQSPPPKTLPHDALLQIHFIGTEKLFADTNSASLKEILAMPETQAFENQTLDKLARTPFVLFQKHLSATNDLSAAIRPLLEDVVQSESFAELRGTNDPPEFVFAIHLAKERSQLWETNLATILRTWTGIAPVQDEVGVWELKKHHAPNLFRFARSGDWTVIGIGQDKLPFQNEMLAAIRKNGRPDGGDSTSWLEVSGDCALWKSRLNLPEPLDRSRFELSTTGKPGALRTRLSLTSPDKFDLNLDAWRVPTNSIQEPLVSFTALRGIGSYGENLKTARDLDLRPFPNQIYFWALEQIPFQTYALAACNDASNTLEHIAPKIISSLSSNLFHRALGEFYWATNHIALNWAGLPPMTPFFQSLKDPSGEFLFIGGFPRGRTNKMIPPDLVAQVTSRTNLVYYDWEITGARIPHWRDMLSLLSIFTKQTSVNSSAPGQKWLDAIRLKCGNTVTEIILTKSNELSFVRKSDLGLTAFELVSLVNWMDSKNFPAFGHQIPPHPKSAPPNP